MKTLFSIIALLLLLSAEAQAGQEFLTKKVEKELKTLEAGPQNYQTPTEIDKLKLLLARYHFSDGNDAKAGEYLAQISVIPRKEMLVEPYGSKIAKGIKEKNYPEAIKVIRSSELIHSWISSVQEAKSDKRWNSAKDQSNDLAHVRSNLCKVAIKTAVIEQNTDALDKIIELEECKIETWYYLSQRVSFHFRAGEYVEGLLKIQKYSADVPKIESVRDKNFKKLLHCSKNADEKHIKALQDLPLNDLSDDTLYVLSLLLNKFEKYDRSLEAAKLIGDQSLRKSALLENLPHTSDTNNSSKSDELLKSADFENVAPILTGGFGIDPEQWYVQPPEEITILTGLPADQQQSYIERIKNLRVRYLGYYSLLNQLDELPEDKLVAPETCDEELKSCILKRIDEIALKEQNPKARDVMYLKTVLTLIDLNDTRTAIEYFNKIVQKDRSITFYDMGNRMDQMAVSNFLRAGNCEYLAEHLPEYFSSELVFTPANDNKLSQQSFNFLSCQIQQGNYDQAMGLQGIEFGQKRNLLQIIIRKLRSEKKYSEALDVIASIPDKLIRGNELSLFAGSASNTITFEREETYKELLKALNSHTAFKDDEDIWARLIYAYLEDEYFSPKFKSFIEPYINHWPAFEAAITDNPHFFYVLCAYRQVEVPDSPFSGPKNQSFYTVFPPKDFTQIPEEKQSDVYRRCIHQHAIPVGNYDAAIWLVENYFPSETYLSKVNRDILDPWKTNKNTAFEIGKLDYSKGYNAMPLQERRQCMVGE